MSKIEVEYEYEKISSVVTTDGDNKTGKLPIVKRKFKGFTKKIPDPTVNKHGKPIVSIVSMEVAMHIQRPAMINNMVYMKTNKHFSTKITTNKHQFYTKCKTHPSNLVSLRHPKVVNYPFFYTQCPNLKGNFF